MPLKIPMLIIVLYLLDYSRAQVETDDKGRTKLFFGNYTGVFVLHGIKPTVWFHPVLGGSDIRYIRYQNFISCNVTAYEEVDPEGNVISSVIADQLKWIFGYQEEIDNKTGNIHSIATLTGTNDEGFIANLIVESWTQGSTYYYGTYLNTVPPNFIELSSNVTGFKFKNSSNSFWVRMKIKMDSPGFPFIDQSNEMQYKCTITTLNTQFSVWFMIYGFLDSIFQPFIYQILADYSDISSFEFVLKSNSFNQSYQYDPNFAVLLMNGPNCDSIGGCHNGVCVEEGVCRCLNNNTSPNCKSRAGATSTPIDEDYGHMAVLLVIGLVVGLGMFMRRRQKLRNSLDRTVQRRSAIIGI